MWIDSAMGRSIHRLAGALLLGCALLVAACGEGPQPDLRRLYVFGMSDAESAPVILIPGVFGSRLRDRASGDEVWPGPWWRILFSSYADLALELDPQSGTPLASKLEAHGIADRVFGRDYYRPILETLTRHGGYAPGVLGTPAKKGGSAVSTSSPTTGGRTTCRARASCTR